MIIIISKLPENTECIYLIYDVYPDLTKNKSFKNVFW